MAYPVSLDELTDGVPSDGTAAATSLGDATYQHDDHHRALAVAVEAVEAELGTAPSGASATVAARFGTLTNDVFTGAVSFGGGISLTGTSSVADRKITMQSVQTLYYPEQAAFSGCLFLGNAGASLAAGAAYDTSGGIGCLAALTTGASNSGLGWSALGLLATGSENTGIGRQALYSVVSGSSNVAVGFSAALLTTGSNSTAVGTYALYDQTSGSNVAVGYNTGRGITTGSGNTILGASITGLAAGLTNTAIIATGGVARLTMDATGTGFNGAAVSAKPTITGSRGSNAALADLLTKLATIGLITDSTS